jgi:Arc/MetJ-type ribon-helix-helix transcriptional regulator
MAQMNVSIPDRLKGWAEQRVGKGATAARATIYGT